MCHKFLRDARYHAFVLGADRETAEAVRAAGCELCASALHSANFPRKPRGGPAGLGAEHELRLSFCCAEDGCRARHTPPSLRFLGRRVYLAAIVVLVAAMQHGVTAGRVDTLRRFVGVSRRTVERWRVWWLTVFRESRVWRAASGRVLPPVEIERLPASLLERFAGDEEGRVLALLRLLGPLTAGSRAMQAF